MNKAKGCLAYYFYRLPKTDNIDARENKMEGFFI